MLYSLLERVFSSRSYQQPSGFNSYLGSLQSRGEIGIPTIREARSDYRILSQWEASYWMI
jgi:hypothetical protein